ncbi:MAG: restriction endonuclease subunit S [Oceanospirillaceae bacterium]|uniref:restriction endonuclease subunit S n=1 Tax=Thalassolituus sp. UBA1505 TaxID=1947653 RepID=UPI000C622CA3|nr:restriction endonuclease subunit S [Thalassolituus sp. UBA1505]MAY01206.1 restriction endonuclease subunit S [Oceanospirillaceae bacterium]MBL36647.1 restriction endonuclease subunit S [Oceanospirillaceae bacterium]MBS55077.1 restriction endonuclease subunit S [Oceanospirillaceae bacterium]|tara:strand:+ start:210 stop:1358 length:1149 start_codon:yes stop_codon:yes gene_type:complete
MVPKGWYEHTLDELALVERGKFSARPRNDPRYYGGHMPFVQTGDVTSSGTYLNGFSQTLNEAGVGVSKVFPKDTILITIAANIGDTAITVFEVACPDSVVAIQPYKDVADVYWLKKHLETRKADLDTQSTQNAQKNINLQVLKPLLILTPPLPEQKKIAQILSTWDKAITTTEQLLASSQQQKKALMQQLLTGKQRLLDQNGERFEGEWKFLTFDDSFKVANKKSAQVKSSDYLDSGSVPVVDQGKQLIAGYCDNDDCYTNVPVIVFGDHTRCLKWVDFEFCPGADGTQVLNTKEFLDKKFGYYLLCHTDIPNLGYSRHMRELKEQDFKVPVDMAEQQKIAAVLSAADQEITTLQQQLDHLKQEKKALMQQLLTGKRRVQIN